MHRSLEKNQELKEQLLGILYFSLQTGPNKLRLCKNPLLWLAERFPVSQHFILQEEPKQYFHLLYAKGMSKVQFLYALRERHVR